MNLLKPYDNLTNFINRDATTLNVSIFMVGFINSILKSEPRDIREKPLNVLTRAFNTGTTYKFAASIILAFIQKVNKYIIPCLLLTTIISCYSTKKLITIKKIKKVNFISSGTII